MSSSAKKTRHPNPKRPLGSPPASALAADTIWTPYDEAHALLMMLLACVQTPATGSLTFRELMRRSVTGSTTNPDPRPGRIVINANMPVDTRLAVLAMRELFDDTRSNIGRTFYSNIALGPPSIDMALASLKTALDNAISAIFNDTGIWAGDPPHPKGSTIYLMKP